MHKRYLAVILAALIIVSLALMGGCKKQDDTAVPTLEIPIEEIPTAGEVSQSTRTTTVYYKDSFGYIVPVTRTIPWADGIAKATLSLMVGSEENNAEAASLGLETVLPEGTEVDINITADKLATVSLSPNANSWASAVDESNMVSAVVCALTEFDSVEEVQLLINGHAIETLKNGTDISMPISRSDINLESLTEQISVTGVNKIELYFESQQSGAMVPVTRMVFSNDDLETAVLELLKGPRPNSGLLATLPTDAALISVTRSGSTVTINFTEEFVNIANEVDGGKNAIKSLMLTCAQFDGVENVKLQVNGKEWEPSEATLAIPTFVNSEDEDVYNLLYE